MAKRQKRTTETAPLKWQEAQNLLKLLKADGHHERRLLFALGFYTGLRISDILRLTWRQIGGKQIEVPEKKTGKIRQIQVNADLAAAIKDARDAVNPADENDILFRSKRGKSIGAPLTREGANIWRTTMARFNPFPKLDCRYGAPMGRHDTRHDFCIS